jgi:hypothetical protein
MTSEGVPSRVTEHDGALVILDPTNPNPLNFIDYLEYVSDNRYRIHSTQGAGFRGELVEFVKDSAGNVCRVKVGAVFLDRLG